VKSIRRISSDLRPFALDDLGLAAAIEWQSNEFKKRSDIAIKLQLDIENLEIDPRQASGIFRIYQEVLTNVMRHANATGIEVSMNQTKNGFELRVQDNGQGFNLSETKKRATLGLIVMRERALILGGELLIESEEGNGTLVTLTIPLEALKK
jgi:signal transduction histidine kinase